MKARRGAACVWSELHVLHIDRYRTGPMQGFFDPAPERVCGAGLPCVTNVWLGASGVPCSQSSNSVLVGMRRHRVDRDHARELGRIRRESLLRARAPRWMRHVSGRLIANQQNGVAVMPCEGLEMMQDPTARSMSPSSFRHERQVRAFPNGDLIRVNESRRCNAPDPLDLSQTPRYRRVVGCAYLIRAPRWEGKP